MVSFRMIFSFLLMFSSVESFTVGESGRTSSALNIFGNLAGAFANDDSLGERENAGIKGVSEKTCFYFG